MKSRSVGMFLLAVFAVRIAIASSDCLEPDTRIVGRWKNGNYYKGLVESLTNSLNVLFDNGNRLSYNLHSKYDVLEDRIPEPNEIKWGDPVVVHRPHSFAFQPAHIREVVGGRYMVWYKDGSYIYQTKNDIRVFNKSTVCNEPAYLGCYRDQVPRYLTVFIPTRPATVATCVDMCNAQGYSVAALRNSDLCFCGNAYNKGYQTSDRRCDMPCYDNPYEKCGGVDTFSQYWTGITGDRPIYRPSGIQAYTKFHMDPYGFKQTYQSAIRKQSIPRFGKLPWKNILQARRAAKRPSSLSQSSPWRWNALTSSWVRADGKQFKWMHSLPRIGFKKSYRTWSSPQAPITRNGWTWNGKDWVSASKMSLGLYPKATSPYSKSTYGKVTLNPTFNKLQAPVKPMVTGLQSYRSWKPPSSNMLRTFSNVDISKDFTPNLVLQKLADRMRTVKWSQLSNFEQAFKPSSSIPLTFRYLGCFADDYQRDLPFQYSMPANSVSVRSCVLKCREHSFSVAGIQSSNQCFCGNTYSKYGRVREEECMMKCGASTTDVCGGVLRNSIYFTGIGSAWPANLPKTKSTQNTIAHAHSTTNDKQAKKVTSAKHTKFGKSGTLSKSKVMQTEKIKTKSSSTEKQIKKPQKSKNKARNKINNAPNEIPEKDNSGIEDYQVESIKVKVNFSELKKALQTLSPEIVRRVQNDLSKIHKKELANQPEEKLKVELEESNRNKNDDYDENDVKRIRNDIHNKALDRLSNDDIKEILRIMKIPKFELKDENQNRNFEDAIKSFHAATKKGKERNGIKVVNGKNVAHEEIESYSRISLDIPLKPTRKSSKTPRKDGDDKRRSYEKNKVKVRGNKKNMKGKSATTIKAFGKVYREKAQSIKKRKKAEETTNNASKNASHINIKKHWHLKANMNAKTAKSHEEKRPNAQSSITNPKASSSKLHTFAQSSAVSKDKNKGQQTNPSASKEDLTELDGKERKISSESKADEMKAKKGAVKIKLHSDAQATNGASVHKENPSSDKEHLLKDKADGEKSVETGPTSDVPSNAQSPLDSDISQAEFGKGKDEKDQSSAAGEQTSRDDKQSSKNRLSGKDDEEVNKLQSQSEVGDNGMISLDGAEKMNEDNSQQITEQNSSENKENVQVDVEKEGEDNGVIYLGAAAKKLQKLEKNEEKQEKLNVPDFKEGVTLDNEGKKANMNPGVTTKDRKKIQREKVDTNEKQKVINSDEKKKTMTVDKKGDKGKNFPDILKKTKKTNDKNVEKLMKTSHDLGNEKKKQTRANKNTSTKVMAKSNEKKQAKVGNKYKHDDSENESKYARKNNDKMVTKELDLQPTVEKKVNKVKSDINANIVIGKDNSAQKDKLQLIPNLNVQTQNSRSSSKPKGATNTVDVIDGSEGSGSSSVPPQTSFEQENKLLSFQKQTSINGKSTNAALKNDSRNSTESIKSGKRKSENANDLNYSGMSDADKVTESKIISKLNHLLNSGSGDDNFEDVVKELEKNKINGISTNGITIKMAQGSGSNSDQESDVNRPQYSSSSSKNAKENKINNKIKSKPIGEDLGGNDKLPSKEKSTHLPSKKNDANDEVIPSGLEDASSGDRANSKYTYFGSGLENEELPMIRSDDLKRLKKGHRNDSFESNEEEPERKSSVLGDEGRTQVLPKMVGERILDVRSSIPTPPRYKMILIPKDNLKLMKKKGEGKFSGNTRIAKVVLAKKTPKINAGVHEIIIAKNMERGGKKHGKKNSSKNAQKKFTSQNEKKLSSEGKKLKKTATKEKHYSGVKGIRVVKNGVAFTVSKGRSSTSRNSRPLNRNNQLLNGSSRNHGETTNTNTAMNNRLKLHHISERRRKGPKRKSKEEKTRSNRAVVSDGEIVDDVQHNLKDKGSRNQLIWRASRSNELNNKNLED